MRQSLSFRVLSPLVFATAIAACGGGGVTPPVEGPLNLDIVAGQDQVAAAGTTQLSDPVVGQLVRLRIADGRWRFRFELVKTAYAQTTVVNGSPVVGAVVCSETVAGNFKPFSVCTNTDANGKATFFYEPGTKAGPQRAEIRGLNAAGQPAVFDTVRATVEPGSADPLYQRPTTPISAFPVTVPATSVVDAYGNAVPFRIVSDGRLTIQGDTVGTVAARTIVSSSVDDGTIYVVELRGANNLLVGRARYRVAGGVLQSWTAIGTSIAP